MLVIEKAIPERDYEQIARLITEADPDGQVSAADIRQWDAGNLHAGNTSLRYAAYFKETLVAYGLLQSQSASAGERFQLWLTVDSKHQQQGFGQDLYDHLLEVARTLKAETLVSHCMDVAPGNLRFAEAQGFGVYASNILSKLDLETFDAAAWQETVDYVRAQGIRLSTLADEGMTPEAQHKLYELHVKCYHDHPGSDGSWNPSFEHYKSGTLDAFWYDPEAQLLAIDGERYVGLSALGFHKPTVAFTHFTGVDADYRRRGIALALKVMATEIARSRGVTVLPTANDSRNVAMLAINKKLGYEHNKVMHRLKREMEGRDQG